MKKSELRDICREARDRRGYTARDLEQLTGIPTSTINNFFATASKVPNVNNAGAICRALGVSLDQFFEITPDLSTEEQVKAAQMVCENERLTEVNGLQKELDKSRMSTIFVLAFLCATLVAVLIFYLFIDFRIQDAGLIRDGEAGVAAWIVILLLTISVGVLVSTLFISMRYSRRFALTTEEERKSS